MNINKAVIVGRVARAPESRALPSGQTVANFAVATSRVWSNQSGEKQEQTEFHNIVAFGRLAEICTQYLTKGQQVAIEGRIQTRSWDDQSGNKRYRTEIVADNMQMGMRPKGAAPQTPSDDQTVPPENIPQDSNAPQEPNVEEIPF